MRISVLHYVRRGAACCARVRNVCGRNACGAGPLAGINLGTGLGTNVVAWADSISAHA